MREILATPIELQTKWTLRGVLCAINEHESGALWQSARLADFYGRDERISGCTIDRISAIVGEDSAPFAFEPATREPDKSKELSERIAEWWDSVVTDSWLSETLHDTIHLGVSFSWISWQTTATEWRPVKLTHFHASAVYWDDNKGCWIANGRVRNGRNSPWQSKQFEIRQGDPNWLIVAPSGARPFMAGAVRSLGVHFLMRSWDFRDIARFCERHGLPILKIMEPRATDDIEQKERFAADLAGIGTTGMVRLPQGDGPEESWNLEPLEMKSRSSDAFFQFNEVLNTSIAIRILGQNLSTEVQGGSFAAAGWHARVKQSIVRGDATGLGTALRDGLVKPWARANVADFDDEIAPWPRWRLVIAEDLQAKATTIQAAYQAMPVIQQSGTPVDLIAFAQKFGVPLIEGAAPNEPTQVTDSRPGDEQQAAQ